MRRDSIKRARSVGLFSILALSVPAILGTGDARAEQPSAPCFPNPNAATDRDTVAARGDIKNLPKPLKDRLVQLADRPHTYLPIQPFAEAQNPDQSPKSSLLFQYYLLDTTGFEPNVFTSIIPGVNDGNVQLTATGGNCKLPTVGAVRLVLEPKPGLPTDPTNPRAFNDTFTDISPLFVINNESGWYEGWMIHDITVPEVAPPRPDGHAQFGKITERDAAILKRMGTHNNVPGNIFTVDGQTPHFPNASDHFPDKQTNVVPLHVSMGTYNAMQQSDVHSYWEFNYTGTNWVHPLYELPFTGGFSDNLGQAPDTFQDGEIGRLQSTVPGPGPSGEQNKPQIVGDNPNLPRDPDKFDADVDAQREFRERGVPSGLANEVYLDVYERLASFEPEVRNLQQRLFDAYAAEVKRVSGNDEGIITAAQGDIDTKTDGFEDNTRLYLPPTVFNRFAVTREINDGLLAPRFAPSQRAWVLSGVQVIVDPPVPASAGQDSDNR
jgi:hypothetical protein